MTAALRLIVNDPVPRSPEPVRVIYHGGAKIRLSINHEHVALVLRVKREQCIGEEVRG